MNVRRIRYLDQLLLLRQPEKPQMGRDKACSLVLAWPTLLKHIKAVGRIERPKGWNCWTWVHMVWVSCSGLLWIQIWKLCQVRDPKFGFGSELITGLHWLRWENGRPAILSLSGVAFSTCQQLESFASLDPLKVLQSNLPSCLNESQPQNYDVDKAGNIMQHPTM